MGRANPFDLGNDLEKAHFRGVGLDGSKRKIVSTKSERCVHTGLIRLYMSFLLKETKC
jgi:hypothetical protein